MKRKISITISFLIIFTEITAFFKCSSHSESSDVITNTTLKTSDSWDVHFKILIDNNWSETRDAYDWCYGFGTELQPYIIENLTVDIQFQDSECLEIRNTEEYFIIQNSKIINTVLNYHGILLYNVTNGNIDGCELLGDPYDGRGGTFVEKSEKVIISNTSIKDCGPGIYLSNSCHNNSISDNYIGTSLGGYGILIIDECNDNNITGNTVEHMELALKDDCSNNIIEDNFLNDTSIYLDHGQYNEILNNFFIENLCPSYYKIDIYGEKHSLIAHNVILWNNKKYNGILLRDNAELNNIYNNLIENCDVAIYLDNESNYNNLTMNKIRNNNKGIILSENHNNTIIYNSFESNKNHAIDDGQDNYWNDMIKGNFWDDYNGLDEDKNNIGDIPYNVSGSASSKDYLPIFNKPGFFIDSPSDKIYWNTEPLICITTIDPDFDSAWYTVNNQVEFLQNNTAEKLRTDIWNSLPQGLFFINFFANGTTGEIIERFVYILIKDTIPPRITKCSADESPHPRTCYERPTLAWIVKDANLNSTWFTLNNQTKKYYFIEAGEYILDETEHKLDTSIWESLPNGEVTITFGANDKAGNCAEPKERVIEKCEMPEKKKETIDGYLISLLMIGFSAISIVVLKLHWKKTERL